MIWMMALAPAWADGCERIAFGDIVDIEPPAVVVLGERKAHQPDLKRAAKVVKKLAKSGTVTLALEAVHRDHQSVLESYVRGAIDPATLPDKLDWEAHWGFAFDAYAPLLALGGIEVSLVAAGLDRGPRPADETVPKPPGYINLLIDTLGDHPVPVALEAAFIEGVAWRDHAIAQRAIEAWREQGYLVILADRFHVEGGLGVAWQAQRLTSHPVKSYLLADADSPCYRGDAIWP